MIKIFAELPRVTETVVVLPNPYQASLVTQVHSLIIIVIIIVVTIVIIIVVNVIFIVVIIINRIIKWVQYERVHPSITHDAHVCYSISSDIIRPIAKGTFPFSSHIGSENNLFSNIIVTIYLILGLLSQSDICTFFLDSFHLDNDHDRPDDDDNEQAAQARLSPPDPDIQLAEADLNPPHFRSR